MRHFPGMNFAELMPTLPIDGVWRALYEMEIDATPGVLVQAFTDFEVTNDTGKPVGVFAAVKLQSDPMTYVNGVEMAECNGGNVTPDMHHGTFGKSGAITVPANWVGPAYVTVWVRAVQTQSGLPDLRVEQDFGRLWVNVYSPNPAMPGEWM